MGYKILKGAMVGILLGVCGGILLTSVLHIAGGGSVRDVVSLFREGNMKMLFAAAGRCAGLCYQGEPHPAPVQAHGGGVLGPAPASQRCRQAAAVLNLSGRSRSHGGKSSHKALWL